ncbi:hypothetical protein [Phenylobacterium sp.]|uniref:hypothetical protein n=1 Tax=Phenylobacterium sp. TaxID=1871053 RepID=UPI002E37D1F2|nr:hypothetical protein [Phenylobacterium sp.]HEX4711711.1 hypothetical protein [Phenylobacterium sp.]
MQPFEFLTAFVAILIALAIARRALAADAHRPAERQRFEAEGQQRPTAKHDRVNTVRRHRS